MPFAAQKPCSHPGCGVLVSEGSRCPDHQRPTRNPIEDIRPHACERGYGHYWRTVTRPRILARDPICMICRNAPSTDVDHVLAKQDGGTDDEGNLQGTCHECHSRKTRQEISERMRAKR